MATSLENSVVLPQPSANTNWQAQLDLGFTRRADKTLLTTRRHLGPLTVQRPFYPEGPEVCHVYVLHPPGGVVGGDRLEINVSCQADAQVLITSPAAGKFYRSAGAPASLTQHLSVSENALLEWLPQENILFSGSIGKMQTTVELQHNSVFIGWEIVCLGRPASGETFENGKFSQSLQIIRNHNLLLADRFIYEGRSVRHKSNWGLAGLNVNGTMTIVGANRKLLSELQEKIQHQSTERFGVSLIDDILICRYLGNHAENARRLFVRIWEIVRPQLIQRKTCPPRIWAT